MSTQRQIEANRRNAAKSTGPRSVEGKAVSRMNALRTGIHAESTIIIPEDPAALGCIVDGGRKVRLERIESPLARQSQDGG